MSRVALARMFGKRVKAFYSWLYNSVLILRFYRKWLSRGECDIDNPGGRAVVRKEAYVPGS